MSKVLQITYIGDAKSVLAAQAQISGSQTGMQTSMQKTAGFFKSFGITAPLAIAAVGIAVIKFGISSVKAFSESQTIMAQTEAVLRSTGGAANVTADDVLGLSSRLRDLTGVDDEAIQASSNLLLTFREVHNELGQGNDIFNQAQVAILDMATALNKGAVPSIDQLKSGTIALGKALNDPIAGMTALKRVGVSFTTAQQDQIKAMVEAGDTMGAQKLILGELKAEFGGAAKAAGTTFAGSLAKLKSHLGDIEENIGAALLPALEDLAATLSNLSEDIGPLVVGFFQIVGQGAKDLAADLDTIIEPFQWLLDKLPETSAGADGAGFSFMNLAHAVQTLVNPLDKIANPSHLIPWVSWKNAVDQATGSTDAATDAVIKEAQAQGGLEGQLDTTAGAATDAAAAQEELARQHQAAAAAARAQRLAVLALSDDFLGILDSATQVSDAQRVLNQLERHGKEDTDAYSRAVADAVIAQSGLESAVLNYTEQLVESGEKQGAIKEKIRDLATQFGVQKGVIHDLIAKVMEYIHSLEDIPSEVNTTVRVLASGRVVTDVPAMAAGGIVNKPTLALIGEAGPEAVIPLGRGGGTAGTNIYVTVQGSVMTENRLVDAIHEGLQRKLRRSGNLRLA